MGELAYLPSAGLREPEHRLPHPAEHRQWSPVKYSNVNKLAPTA